MKPADQEFVHKPEIGQYGDCQRAVIASLLELPLREVPHFLADGDVGEYWDRLQGFLGLRGMAWMETGRQWKFWGEHATVYHEISGPSPRGNGVLHAVVGCNGEIIHDPHPSRAGLAGDPNEWTHSFLINTASKGQP